MRYLVCAKILWEPWKQRHGTQMEQCGPEFRTPQNCGKAAGGEVTSARIDEETRV